MSVTIPEVDLLSAEDEVRLARAIEAGVFAEEALARHARPCGASEADLVAVVMAGRSAHDEFFNANLRMAARLAHEWAKRTGLPAEELLQEGCVGLGEAIRRWDYKRGHRFSTMAYSRVEWAISAAALLRCGQLEASRFQARSAVEIRRAWQLLETRLGRGVGINELAESLGREPASVAKTLQLTRPGTLTDELLNVIADLEAPATDEPRGCEPDWMSELPDQERIVLQGRFGIGGPVLSLAALAARLNVSQSTIRRREKRAMNRARRLLGAA